MSKFFKLSEHCYIVENQNGFNNALYNYFGCGKESGEGYTKEQVRGMVQNYPKSYPTEIIIIDQTFECMRVYIEEFNIPLTQIAHMDIGFNF